MLSFSVKPTVLKSPIRSLLGFCDLIIADRVLVEGFKVFKNQNGGLFIKAPSRKATVKDEAGNEVEKWFPTTRFIDEKAEEKDWTTPFEKEVHTAMVDAFKTAMNSSGNTGSSKASTSTEGASSSPKTRKSNPLW